MALNKHMIGCNCCGPSLACWVGTDRLSNSNPLFHLYLTCDYIGADPIRARWQIVVAGGTGAWYSIANGTYLATSLGGLQYAWQQDVNFRLQFLFLSTQACTCRVELVLRPPHVPAGGEGSFVAQRACDGSWSVSGTFGVPGMPPNQITLLRLD